MKPKQLFEECRHIKVNGLKCQSPALRGSRFCYYHARNRVIVAPPPKRHKEKVLELPPLQNRDDIQTALNQIMQALASQQINPARAGKFLYALQLAQKSLDDAPFSAPVFPASVQPVSPSSAISLSVPDGSAEPESTTVSQRHTDHSSR